MVTIAGRLNRSWFGKIPVGLRWLLVLALMGAVAFVAIKFTVASSDAMAQQVVKVPVAAGPQVPVLPSYQTVPQVPAPQSKSSPATGELRLTAAERQKFDRNLGALFGTCCGGPRPGSKYPDVAARIYHWKNNSLTDYHSPGIKSFPYGPITKAANGTYRVDMRVQAWNTPKLLAQKDVTLYIVLNAKGNPIDIAVFEPHK